MRLAVAIVVWVVAALAAGCGADGRTTVHVAVVERRDLLQIVVAKGSIEPAGYATVGAKHMGRVVEVLVQEGDWVKKGQPLARLETIQPETDVAGREARLAALLAEVKAARAALGGNEATRRAQQATLERLEAELKQAAALDARAKLLNKDGLIARQEMERRRDALAAAQHLVIEARENVLHLSAQREQFLARRDTAEGKAAALEAELRRIAEPPGVYAASSPIDGMVTDVRAPAGETVVPGVANTSASLVITVADMSRVEAVLVVEPSDWPKLRAGQTMEIAIDALPDRSLTTIITGIGGAFGEFQVTAELENPPKSLRPGMKCAARILTAERPGVLAAATESLVFRAIGDAGEAVEGVFVVEAETAQFRPVRTSIEADGLIEVLSGLTVGEQIVIADAQALRSIQSGDKVRVANETQD